MKFNDEMPKMEVDPERYVRDLFPIKLDYEEKHTANLSTLDCESRWCHLRRGTCGELTIGSSLFCVLNTLHHSRSSDENTLFFSNLESEQSHRFPEEINRMHDDVTIQSYFVSTPALLFHILINHK